MKVIILIIGFIIVLSSFAYADLTDGLIAYWSFDDVDIDGDNITDISKNNNDLIIFNGLSGRVGKVDEAFECNGDNTYFRTDLKFEGNLLYTNGSVTIWIKPNVVGEDKYIYSGRAEPGASTRFYFNEDAGDIATQWGTGVRGVGFIPVVGTWYHVVIIWNTSDADVYVNGEFDETVDKSSWTSTAWNYGGFAVCTPVQATSGAWNGTIDEFGFWNRTLTSDDVSDLYNDGDGFAYPFPIIANESDIYVVNGSVRITSPPAKDCGFDGSEDIECTSSDRTPSFTWTTNGQSACKLWNESLNYTILDTRLQEEGLVAAYRFNQNDSRDLTYTGNDGTVTGAVWNEISGVNDTGGFEFDGDTLTGIDMYNFVALNNNSNFTVMQWMKLSTTVANQVTYSKTMYQGSGDCGFWLEVDANNYYWIIKNSTGDSKIVGYPNNYPAINEWVHFAMTVRTVSGGINISIYNNSQLYNSKVINDICVNTGDILEMSQRFNGTIDEVRIYNRSLSASEINSLYLQGGDYFNSTPDCSTTNQTNGENICTFSENLTLGIHTLYISCISGEFEMNTFVDANLFNVSITPPPISIYEDGINAERTYELGTTANISISSTLLFLEDTTNFSDGALFGNLTFSKYASNLTRDLNISINNETNVTSATITFKGYENNIRLVEAPPSEALKHFGITRAYNNSDRILSIHNSGAIFLMNSTDSSDEVCQAALQPSLGFQQGLAMTNNNTLWVLNGSTEYRAVSRCTGIINCIDSDTSCVGGWAGCYNYTCEQAFTIPSSDASGFMIGIAAEVGDYLYVAAYTNKSILKYTDGGTLQSKINLSFTPTGIYFDGTYIYVGVSNQLKLVKMDVNGNIVRNYTIPNTNCGDASVSYFLDGLYIRHTFNYDYLYAGVYTGGLRACIYEFPNYPKNLTIDTNIDGIDYLNTSVYNGTSVIDINISALNKCKDACNNPVGDDCICTVRIGSNSSGILEYSDLSVVYTDALCIDIDHPDFGVNYSCQKIADYSINYSQTDIAYTDFGNGTTSQNVSTGNSFNITGHKFSLTSFGFQLTGFEDSGYPENIKIDLFNDGSYEAIYPNYLNGTVMHITEFTNGLTTENITFLESGTSTRYANYSMNNVEYPIVYSNPKNMTFQISGFQDIDPFTFTDYFYNTIYVTSSVGTFPYYYYDDFTHEDVEISGKWDDSGGGHEVLGSKYVWDSETASGPQPSGSCCVYTSYSSTNYVYSEEINLEDHYQVNMRLYLDVQNNQRGEFCFCTTECHSSGAVGIRDKTTDSNTDFGLAYGQNDYNKIVTIKKVGNYLQWYESGVYVNQMSYDSDHQYEVYFRITAQLMRNANDWYSQSCPATGYIYPVNISGFTGNYTGNMTWDNTGLITSILLYNASEDITRVKLTTYKSNTDGGSETLWVSNDNAITWESTTSGAWTVFSSVGNELLAKLNVTVTDYGEPFIIDYYEITTATGTASDIKIDVGNDGDYEFNLSGVLNETNSPQNISIDGNEIKEYMVDNCIGELTCPVPIVFIVGSAGIVNYKNIVGKQEINLTVFNTTIIGDYLSGTDKNITFKAIYDYGILLVSDIDTRYLGDKATNITAHVGSVRVSQLINWRYSPFDVSIIPQSIDYWDIGANIYNWIQNNIPPFGNADGDGNPFFKVSTSEFHDDGIDIYVKYNESVNSCVTNNKFTGGEFQPQLCYQETANISVSCGGLGTGTYGSSYSGYFSAEWNDGNWDTYIINGGNHLYVNYTKPNNAINSSFWRVKDGNASVNLTISPSCWNYNDDKLIFHEFSTISSADMGRSYWYCYDGTWNVLRDTNLGYHSYYIYEEAMWWNIRSYTETLNISINTTGQKLFADMQNGDVGTISTYTDIDCAAENSTLITPLFCFWSKCSSCVPTFDIDSDCSEVE